MNPLNHVAIIMDGNGRWGLKNKNSRNQGHKAGLNTVEKIIKETIKQKIKYLTLYAFSTENWKRPKTEINYLFNLLESFLLNKIDLLHRQNIKLKVIGTKIFSKKLNKLINSSEKKTSNNTILQINLALNYGSKFEILIRTGNTKRLSNFLLWQLAYSEIFFEKKLWPDFNEKNFRKIILNFKKIKRNFGGI